MIDENPAAFGRLCVETTVVNLSVMDDYGQPPSGGCVLKQYVDLYTPVEIIPAAFGRLCVETCHARWQIGCMAQPPSGGCVLKQVMRHG